MTEAPIYQDIAVILVISLSMFLISAQAFFMIKRKYTKDNSKVLRWYI